MSTSKRAKEARQKKLAAEKKQRELKKAGISTIKQKRKPKEFKDYVPTSSYRPEEQCIPSLSSSEFNTFKREGNIYTGSYVKGVMETHKSNIVPVVDDEHIVAITKMRRN